MDGVPLLQDYLIRTARRLPDKVALVSQKQRLTYSELEARTNALSNALVRRGLERGDRAIVFADNTIETAISFWAILKANGVVSIVHPSTKAERLAYLLNDCRASVLITHGHLTPTFAVTAARSPHLKSIVIAGG